MEFTIILTGEDLSLIGQGLGNLPYSKVVDLVGRLQKQISEQDKKEDLSNN